MLDDLERRFQYDDATVKVDWALDGPIPWSHPDARRAGTIHIAEGIDALTAHAAELARDLIPSRPFLLLGQYSMLDQTRAPAGKETAWAYTHTPQRPRGDAGPDGLTGAWDERETEAFVERMESQVEELAPGFRGLIRARHVFTPPMFERHDENLVGGALNGGTAQLHQQLVFRPVPRLRGRPETPIKGLYLGSASAHPGGGVHGACGANAARAALRKARARSRT
jgi:phytoene dehydrogenase-like protein